MTRLNNSSTLGKVGKRRRADASPVVLAREFAALPRLSGTVVVMRRQTLRALVALWPQRPRALVASLPQRLGASLASLPPMLGALLASLPSMLLALLAASPAGAQELTGDVTNAEWGVSFTVPDGWVGRQGQGGYVFGSHTVPGFILLLAHEYESVDALRAEAAKGLDDGYGTRLDVDGAIDPFGKNGLAAAMSGVVEGQPARAYVVSLVAPQGGGLTILTATDPSLYTDAHAERIERMAESVRFTEPAPASVDAGWNERLRGSRLTYLYSYYSGGMDGSYAGASEKTVIDLCSAGHFFYSGSSSLAVDGGTGGGYNASGHAGGSEQGAGQWEVITRAGGPTLQLNFRSGEVATYAITYPDEKLHLNGERYYWTTHGSPAEYRPQCP